MSDTETLKSKIAHAELRYSRKRIFGYAWILFSLILFVAVFLAYRSVQEATHKSVTAKNERLAAEAKLAELDQANEQAKELAEILRGQIQTLRTSLATSHSELIDTQSELAALLRSGPQELIHGLILQTIYVGDGYVGGHSIEVDSGIQLSCSQLHRPEEIEAAAVSSSPEGFRFVRIDRIASFAGGKCGNVIYAAAYAPI